MPTVGLVVPVYNEAPRVDEFVWRLLDWAGENRIAVVFVDDGSTDGTADQIEAIVGDRAVVIRRPHQGKGAAIAAGIRTLTTDVRGFCDLDLSTPLDDLARILALAARSAVLAIGSRDVVGSVLTTPEGKVRETLGRTYNRLLQLLITPGVVDTQCGAKAASAEVWERLLDRSHETGFAWDAELVATAMALSIPVREVPVTWAHDDRTRVRVMADGTAMVWAAARIARRTRQVRKASEATSPPTPPPATVEGQRDHIDELLAAGDSHWWFRSRAALASTALRRAGASPEGWLVDVGAGPGSVTAAIGWRPDRLLVVEPDARVASAARRLGLSSVRAGGEALGLATGSASVVLLLDVLEHLDVPEHAVAEVRRVLRPGGHLVVMVPAHPSLWSEVDERLGHRRRYRRRDLRAAIVGSGFTPVLETAVLGWAVPPMAVVRKVLRRPSTGLRPVPAVVDRCALVLTSLERHLIGRVSVPWGTSLLHVYRAVP